MGTTDNNTWTRIRQSVRETGRFVGRKQYNMAMIKARQTLEFMVNCLGEKALIVDGDLADSIDQLYEGRWISQVTKDHYHRIRVIGNKAVHEGNDSPYDADEAYELLSQEVDAFADIYSGRRRSTTAAAPQRHRTGSRPAPTSQRNGVQRNSGSHRNAGVHGNVRHSGHRPAPASRSRRRPDNKGFVPYDLMRPILIFLIIFVIVLACVGIFKLAGNKSDKTDAASSPSTPEATTQLSTPEESATPPEQTTQSPKIYKTTARPRLNVRAEPSNTSALRGTLAVGTVVDYVGAYDDDWAIIKFEGQEAYVSSRYLSAEDTPKTQETGT